jgi:hypothetical protein
MTTNAKIFARLQRLAVAELASVAQSPPAVTNEKVALDNSAPASLPPVFATYYPRLRRLATAGWPVLLVGPAATGKSTAVRQLAEECGATLYVQQAYRSLQVEDIRGTRGLKDGSTQFEPGVLTKSLLDANGWYLLEEVNSADAGILVLLNNLLDGAGEMTIPETGERIVRKPGWRFFAACNPGYHGTQELNQALVSRCELVECEVFPPEVESEILRRHYPALGKQADDIALIAMAVREARASGAHDFDMCLRTCQQLAEEFLAAGNLREAFRLTVLPKIGDPLTFGPVRDGLYKAIDLLL